MKIVVQDKKDKNVELTITGAEYQDLDNLVDAVIERDKNTEINVGGPELPPGVLDTVLTKLGITTEKVYRI